MEIRDRQAAARRQMNIPGILDLLSPEERKKQEEEEFPMGEEIDKELALWKQRLATMLERRERKTVLSVDILQIAEFVFIGRDEDLPVHRFL